MKMPMLDGLTAVKQFRKIDNDIPVIAQTDYFVQDDDETCIQAGRNDHFPKPTTKDWFSNCYTNICMNDL